MASKQQKTPAKKKSTKKSSSASSGSAKQTPAKPKSVKAKPLTRRQYRRQQRKQERSELTKLPPARSIIGASLSFLRSNKRVFGRMAALYGLFYFALARTVPEFALEDFNQYLESEAAIDSGLSRASILVDIALTGNNTPTISIIYGLLLLVIVSLATFWTIRAIKSQKRMRARDGYYQGLTGFVPYIGVMLVIALQMVPFAIGALIYSAAVGSIAVVGTLEEAFFVLLWVILSLPTIYWLSSSILALVIVSIPGYYPMQAIETAKNLVGARRAQVVKRALAASIMIGGVFVLILLVSIIILPAIAFVVRDAMLIMLPFVANVVLYKLYESLLADE